MNLQDITLYLASGLFTRAEIDYNWKLYEALTEKGFKVLLPQAFCDGLTSPFDIFEACVMNLQSADVVIANLEGTDVDSGTSWECGYSFAKNIPIIAIRTDFRQRGDDDGLNCMLSQSIDSIIYPEPDESIKSIVDQIISDITEKMEY